eukprot:m.141318 g.141318  ORF g.141318 m.141318 type:complete len:875 (+) comp14844_c0_seq5:131-2755(+)
MARILFWGIPLLIGLLNLFLVLHFNQDSHRGPVVQERLEQDTARDGSLDQDDSAKQQNWHGLQDEPTIKWLQERTTQCPYSVFHFTWKVPSVNDKATPSGGKLPSRVLANSTFTGCCDRTVALAISSVLVHYPDAIVILWLSAKDGKLREDLTQDRLRQQVVNSNRLYLVKAGEKMLEELSQGTDAQRWFKSHAKTAHEAVKWSDMLRLVLLWKLGGTYLDSDAVTINPVTRIIQDRHAPICNRTRIFSRFRSNSIHMLPASYMEGETTEKERDSAYFYVQNGLLFGFPPGDPVFKRAIKTFVTRYESGNTGFFVGGPMDFSRNLREEMDEEMQQSSTKVSRFHFVHNSRLCIMAGDRPNRHNMTKTQRMIFIDRSFKKDKSGAFDTALLWHTDLDNGDLDVGSAAWHLLQRYANLLAALDKLPQPMVFSGSIVKGLVQHDPYIWPPVLIMRAAECPRPCENQLFHDVIKPKAISVLNDDGSLKKSSRISSMKWRKLTTRLRLRAEACPYNVFHFTWHMPEPSVEEGVPQGNKGFVKRVYSKGNVTGCCDRTVALAITSVLVHYPDAEVVLWTQGDPLLDESLVQTRLVNSTRVHVVSLNGKVEKAFASGTPAFDWVQGHSKSTHESIKWSDLFRLLILWHVGGSYFDADAITTSSVKSFARQRDLPLCNATRMLSVKPAVGGSIPSAAVPDWDGRVEKRKESGGRKEFNYYAQNGLLFGFPPNDPIFVRAMEIFVEGYSKGRTGFFSGGPQDFSRAVAATLREEEAKHLSPNQSIHFSQGVCDCSNHAASNTKLNVEVKDANPNTLILHTDLDYGDLETGSRTYLMLQKYAYALETLEKRKQPLLDGIPHTPLKHVDVLREKECIAWNCHLAK